MEPYYADEAVTLHLGDCLKVLADLPDASVDAVVTDPPYELTDGREQDCASDVLRNAIIRDAAYRKPASLEGGVSFRVDLAAARSMGVGGIDLNDETPARDVEVGGNAPVSEIDDMLVNDCDPVVEEEGERGEFRLWVREGSARCVGACRCVTHGSPTSFRIPVGLRYDPLGESEASPGVMALPRAEVAAVLTFDLPRRTVHVAPACGAEGIEPRLLLIPTQAVGARSAARRLASMLQSNDIGHVGASADGAGAFYLRTHTDLLRFARPIIRQKGFMGRQWDGSGIAFDERMWRQCLRVLKPGGHLLAFGGTRTYHRMACAIEDAGFEIRESLHWIYGSGFPKSLDVSAAIDKTKRRDYVLAAAGLGLAIPGNNLHDWTKAEHSPGDAWWEKFKALLSPEDWGRIERAVIGKRASGATAGMQALGPSGIKGGQYVVTAPATDDARRWSGFGTALKPAHEPIVLARRPLAGTVAATVLAHGTGALNVGACRVAHGSDVDLSAVQRQQHRHDGDKNWRLRPGHEQAMYSPAGRWPSNVVFTHSAECVEDRSCVDGCPVAEMDRQSGVRPDNSRQSVGKPSDGFHGGIHNGASRHRKDTAGGASRYFPVFRSDKICSLFGRIMECDRAIGAQGKFRQNAQLQDSAVSDAWGSQSQEAGVREASSVANASTAESLSATTSQTEESTAPESAPMSRVDLTALLAASAGSLCDSCVTAIAQSVAAMRRGHSATQALGLPSTHDFSERILIRNLALIAEDLESTGTTSTTSALTTSLGCVVDAIRTYTTRVFAPETRKSDPPVLKYEAKAPASERPRLADGTAWPTVKPLGLMRWLIRLITPPGGLVLDCFAGSGATAEAAVIEGFRCLLIERDLDAAELIRTRLSKPIQPTLGDIA